MIVEAGAYDGSDTLRFAHGAAHVHAFEPVPVLYEQLTDIVANVPNVTAWPLALGDCDDERRIWISSGGGTASSSLLAPHLHGREFPGVAFSSASNVPVTTLATWARREQVGRVDGLWLDMQGAELGALQAAGPVLDTVHAIVLEISTVELYERMPLWSHVRLWLNTHGFRVAQIEMARPSFGNALVVRR